MPLIALLIMTQARMYCKELLLKMSVRVAGGNGSFHGVARKAFWETTWGG